MSARTKIPSFKTVACEEVEIDVEIDILTGPDGDWPSHNLSRRDLQARI